MQSFFIQKGHSLQKAALLARLTQAYSDHLDVPVCGKLLFLIDHMYGQLWSPKDLVQEITNPKREWRLTYEDIWSRIRQNRESESLRIKIIE